MKAELSAIDEQIAIRRRDNPRLSYADAWLLVASEMPKLLRAYNQAAENAERSNAGQSLVPGSAKIALSEIDREIAKKRQANPRLNYAEAWKLVASEKPGLIRDYNSAAARSFLPAAAEYDKETDAQFRERQRRLNGWPEGVG
jgi:hypothetical protein